MSAARSAAARERPGPRIRFAPLLVVPLVSALQTSCTGVAALFGGGVVWSRDATAEWAIANGVLLAIALVYATITAAQLFARKTPHITCALALVFVPLAIVGALTWPDAEIARGVDTDAFSLSPQRDYRVSWLLPVLIALGIAAGTCTPLWPRCSGAVKVLQRGAGAIALVLLCAGCVRALRYPDPNEFVASLPPMAQVTAVEYRQVMGSSSGSGRYPSRYAVEPLPGTRCNERCVRDLVRMTLLDWPLETVLLRRDDRHQLWFTDPPPVYSGPHFVPFTGNSRSMKSPVYARELADALAPASWMLLATALGLLLALGCGLYYWSAERQLGLLRSACSDVHVDGSTELRRSDDATLELLATSDLPVRSKPAIDSGDAPYREVGKVLEVETARLRGALDGLSQRALAARVFALVFLCLCTAPLAGAAVHGLVF